MPLLVACNAPAQSEAQAPTSSAAPRIVAAPVVPTSTSMVVPTATSGPITPTPDAVADLTIPDFRARRFGFYTGYYVDVLGLILLARCRKVAVP